MHISQKMNKMHFVDLKIYLRIIKIFDFVTIHTNGVLEFSSCAYFVINCITEAEV